MSRRPYRDGMRGREFAAAVVARSAEPRRLDGPIAAMAMVGGLGMVTRITASFRDVPIALVDPGAV